MVLNLNDDFEEQRAVREAAAPGVRNEEGADQTRDIAAKLVDHAKATADLAYDAIADEAAAAVKEQRSSFTGSLNGVAETARRISGAIREGENADTVSEYAAQYTETAAKKIEMAAEYFEYTDIKGMARDLESYARRNPAIFLGTAFALGVLIARFAKSSPPPPPLTIGAAQQPQGRSASAF